ncbi:hypothetical protein TRIP_B70003 [uncultured Desulfatiglans sp.]|nr:hypothetical protein TRIP_B70003 [uncultured Desulfatiglans sp.]
MTFPHQLDSILRFVGAPYAPLINPNGGIAMSDSDGSHSCQNMTQELIQEEPEDPGPRRLRHATRDVNGRHRLRA